MIDFLRPSVRAMAGYTPGEQPRGGDIVKLNTNENPSMRDRVERTSLTWSVGV